MGQEAKSQCGEHHTVPALKREILLWSGSPRKQGGAARRWRSVSSLALLASIRNIVIPLSRSRNYFFIDKMRCSHFSGLPDCHCKQVSLKCISEKVDPIYRGTRSDFLEQWRSYVLHLFIIFNRWLFVWGKQMCYRTLLLSRITSSYITNVCPVLAKNTVHACAPSVYLLYSNTEDILAIRERGKISSLLHLEVDWNAVVKLQRLGGVLHLSDTVILWTNVPKSCPF